MWLILGRTRPAREEVPEEADEVCSVRMVVLWAMHALGELSVCGRVGYLLFALGILGRTRVEGLEGLMRTPLLVGF